MASKLWLILALLIPSVALADGIDNFTWFMPQLGYSFSWAWQPSGPPSQYTTFTSGSLTYAAQLGNGFSIEFSCISAPTQCDNETEWFENFSSNFYSIVGGTIHLIPGNYVPGPWTDFWGADMSIVDPPASSDEPGTIVLQIFGMAMVGLLAMYDWKRRKERKH